ncbi:MAG: glycosyltransferase family 4 protein, partial [Gemmatimonadota bacterium]
TVFSVAHMYPRKNLAALVRAALTCSRALPEVSFRIAGHGPEFERLRRLISELKLHSNISLLGQISHEQLIREFVSCDIFCLPSLQEGFGIAFLEAMATGKPVVACRASSTPELVRHGINGLLATPHDDNDLAEQLICLLRDEDLRTRMGATNRVSARQYDASVTVPRLVDLISRA